MDVEGKSNADKANIHQWSDNGDDNVMFVNKQSGKCMDVTSSGATDGTNIQQYWCNGTNAQLFTLVPAALSGTSIPLGRYTIKSVNSNLCMDVDHSKFNNGANIQQWSCNGTNAQAFDLVVNGGYYNLKNVNSGKLVDVSGVSTSDGANIAQWEATNGDNQRFSFINNGNSQYEIHAKHSGKCVDVSGWSQSSGGNVQQWSCGNSQANQKWMLSLIN